MRSNFFLKSKIDAVSCISGLKRLKSRAAWYVSFCFAQFVLGADRCRFLLESIANAIKHFLLYLLIGIIYFGMSHECHKLLSVVVWSKTSFIFLCSKDSLRITNGMGIMFGFYCGNMTGKNLLVTGDQVII